MPHRTLTSPRDRTYRRANLEEISAERTQRTYIRVSFGALLGFILLIAVCWGGRNVYVRWQERRLVRQAAVALAKNDLRSASLAARTALEIKPTSASAARLMADVCERTGERSALDWRRQVARLEPNSLDDRLAWARCALKFNDIPLATTVLSEVDERGKQTAGYHAVAALLAEARKQFAPAITHWKEAVRLDPDDARYQLQLGIASLNGTEPEQGKAILQQLRNDPTHRAAATRALLADAVAKRRPAAEVVGLARDLQNYPEATFADRLTYVDFLHQAHDEQFTSALTDLEKSAATKPDQLAALLTWMSQNGLALVAFDYIQTLPPAAVQKWPTALSAAEVDLRLGKWQKLEQSLKSSSWPEADFLRHAYLARAAEERGDAAEREREWAATLKAVTVRSDLAMTLLRTVAAWRWQSAVLDVLWSLSKQRDKQGEALGTLYRYYAGAGDTRGLYKVLADLHQADPGNTVVANNLANISLLLNVDVANARRLAAEVYQKEPNNPAYLTTYAYALLNQGDTAGALRVMNRLTSDQLSDPTISAYYGICLAEAGDERARAFLEAGASAPNLLPEEKELIRKSQQRLK